MKIALVGSAPSSVRLAPYADPSWTVWACSPGAYATIGQSRAFRPGDAFFELHRWEPPVIGDPTHQVTWFSPEYCQWLREYPGMVYTGEHIPEIKNSVRLPREELLSKYGPFFFTSSLAWMLAMAIETPGIKEIGLWGVDMSATEEYAQQRPGCQFFVQIALQRGIRITVPPESDLLQPMPLYGVGEWDPMAVKSLVRLNELESRLAGANQRMQQAQQEIIFLQGALDNHKYWRATWVGTASIEKLLANPPTADVIQLRGAAD